jgi:uncharacterized protein YmfQ (DUF2313 family)
MAKQIEMGELGRQLFAKIMKATASDGTYSEVMQETVKSKSQYTDEAFPPNETSLINDWEETEVYGKVRLWRQFEWIRAT